MRKKEKIVYLIYFGLIVLYGISFWLFGYRFGALGYSILIQWFLCFLTLIAVCCLLAIFKNGFCWKDALIPLFLSLILLVYQWTTFPLANMITCWPKFNWPDFGYFGSALFASYISYFVTFFIKKIIKKKHQ